MDRAGLVRRRPRAGPAPVAPDARRPVSATRIATLRRDVTTDRTQARTGLSVTTLMIASLSSLAAALVVSKLWGGGTLVGAAMTPVVVAPGSEGLRRPATIVTSVRETRSSRYDPVAEGRAGLREGDLQRARPTMPAAAAAERRVHRVSGGGGSGISLRLPRARVIAAVVTGLVAFALAGVFLTGSELVLGKSVVSSSKRTTFVPVHRSTSTTTTTKTTDTTPTTTTTTTTTPPTSTPATSEPPATAPTPTAPPTQTAPPATTSPAPQAAPPATPTTPAPQSATPPASTTP